MAKRSKSNRLSWKQLGIALGITIAVAYAVAILGVMSRSIRASSRVAALRAETDELEAEKEHLTSLIEYVQSDYYTEMVAREQLKWHLPGEKVFSPLLKEPDLAPRVELSADPPTAREPASPQSRWLEILDLFARKTAP